jgi:hypothetical protein
LRAHAERHFELSSPADKESRLSVREVLEAQLDRALRSGRDRSRDIASLEAELALPPMPMGLLYLWQAYHRLRRRKGGSGFGASPIEWPDIDAFVRNSRFELAPWELEILEMLDDLYMTQQARSQSGAI